MYAFSHLVIFIYLVFLSDMARCEICEQEISDNNGELCKTCFEFLEWKYNKKSGKRLGKFKEFKKYLDDWKSGKKEVEKE